MVPRCYKCLGYGHYRTDGKRPDRHDCCRKCGKNGHKEPVLCSAQESGGAAHVPGSALCTSFKIALTEAKARQKSIPT